MTKDMGQYAAQTERILKRLEQAPLTAGEAITELGVMRLAARIHDLRNAGYAISCETVVVPNRFSEESRVARYSMVPDNNHQPKQETIMNETNQRHAGVIIASDDINQRQAIAVAVTKGLADSGFTNVTVHVDKGDDPTRMDITPENAPSLLQSMRDLNPQLFNQPVGVFASSGAQPALDLVQNLIADTQRVVTLAETLADDATKLGEEAVAAITEA